VRRSKAHKCATKTCETKTFFRLCARCDAAKKEERYAKRARFLHGARTLDELREEEVARAIRS
jgi:hypothetical protein